MQKVCQKCSRTLDQFGRKYPPKQPDGYLVPSLAADNIILKKSNNDTQILLIKRGHEPSIGKYAFPGGHVDYGEDLETAVLRELKEECNLVGKNPKLFNVYGKGNRDVRKHVISVIYSVEVDDFSTLKAGDDASDAVFLNLNEALNLSEDNFAFDHHQIIKDFVADQNKTKI